MKFRTNFSFPLGRLVSALAAAGWVLALLAAVGGVSMVVAAAGDRRENPALKSRLGELGKIPLEREKPDSMPSSLELEELQRHLRGLNSLEAGAGLSLSSILSRLERILPPGARLMSFQLDQRSGEIQLVVEAEGLEDLSGLLAALEGDNAFTKVNPAKQSQAQGSHGIQFSVDMMENRP